MSFRHWFDWVLAVVAAVGALASARVVGRWLIAEALDDVAGRKPLWIEVFLPLKGRWLWLLLLSPGLLVGVVWVFLTAWSVFWVALELLHQAGLLLLELVGRA